MLFMGASLGHGARVRKNGGRAGDTAKGQRIGIRSPQKLLGIRRDVLASLDTVGCTSDEQERAGRFIEKIARSDMANRIRRTVDLANRGQEGAKRLPPNHPFLERLNELQREGGLFIPAAPEKFRQACRDAAFTDSRIEEALTDYEAYHRDGKWPTRPEIMDDAPGDKAYENS
jgi:hypothetical protein